MLRIFLMSENKQKSLPHIQDVQRNLQCGKCKFKKKSQVHHNKTIEN